MPFLANCGKFGVDLARQGSGLSDFRQWCILLGLSIGILLDKSRYFWLFHLRKELLLGFFLLNLDDSKALTPPKILSW